MKAPFTLWRVKHWHEVGGKLVKRPQVNFFPPNQYSILTDAFQYFWFNLNGGFPCDPNTQKWNGYTNGRAFITDTQGTEVYRNVISGKNLNKGPPRIKRLACGGNVVKGTVSGKFLIVETIKGPKNKQDVVSPPWGMTYENRPWFIHHATNRHQGDVVNPFTMFGGRNTGVPVLYPFMGWGAPLKISLKLLERIEPGQEIPSPYVPPMEKEIEMSEKQVVELMKSSKSEIEWDANCDFVQSKCGGYPSFWYGAIVLSGVASKTASSWGGDADVLIITK